MIGFALYGDEAIHELAEELFDLRIAFLNALSCHVRGVLPWLEDEPSLHHHHTPGNSRLLTGSIWARRRIDVPGDHAQR